jgi:acyl carrier protein
MERKVEKLMANLFDIKQEDVTDRLTMKNTEGWDSLKHMELVVSIEGTFGVELAFDDIVAMQTLKDIKKILKAKGVNGEDGFEG